MWFYYSGPDASSNYLVGFLGSYLFPLLEVGSSKLPALLTDILRCLSPVLDRWLAHSNCLTFIDAHLLNAQNGSLTQM